MWLFSKWTRGFARWSWWQRIPSSLLWGDEWEMGQEEGGTPLHGAGPASGQWRKHPHLSFLLRCRDAGLMGPFPLSASWGKQRALHTIFLSCLVLTASQCLCSLFFKLIFYWRIIALWNLAVFCQTSTWISHRYTYIYPLPFEIPKKKRHIKGKHSKMKKKI